MAAYAALADWWSDAVKGTRVRLFIGQGLYRVGAERIWQPRELVDQMRYNQMLFNVDGTVIFSYRNVFMPGNGQMKEAVSRILQGCWRYPARLPDYPNVR